MSATQAIQKMRSAGFELMVASGRLLVHPVSRLSQEQRSYIRRHKAELIDELMDEIAEIRPHSPRVRPDGSKAPCGISPNSPLSPSPEEGKGKIPRMSWPIRWTLETWLDATEADDLDRQIVHDEIIDDPTSIDCWLKCAANWGIRPEQAPPDPETAISICPTCGHVYTGEHRCWAPPEAPERVRCADCRHFQPDEIGNGSGIGDCRVDAWQPGEPLLYPSRKRICGQFTRSEERPGG